jgi:hypothetical protein
MIMIMRGWAIMGGKVDVEEMAVWIRGCGICA